MRPSDRERAARHHECTARERGTSSRAVHEWCRPRGELEIVLPVYWATHSATTIVIPCRESAVRAVTRRDRDDGGAGLPDLYQCTYDGNPAPPSRPPFSYILLTSNRRRSRITRFSTSVRTMVILLLRRPPFSYILLTPDRRRRRITDYQILY